MNVRAIASFGLFILIYNGLSFYIGWNVWVWLNTSFSFESVWLYSLVFALLAYGYLIGRFSLSFFKIAGAYWIGFFQYALLLFPIANVVVFLLNRLTGVSLDSAIMYTGLVTALSLVVIFLIGTFQAYRPVKRTYSLSIPKQGARPSSIKIAMASDMHFGALSGKGHLKRLVKEIEAIQPDMVVFPGDIIDDSPDVFKKKNMGDVMKQIKAPLGVYGVLGNHEYYGRQVQEIINELAASGVTMLTDDSLLVDDRFYIAGRRDRTDKNRLSVEALLGDLDHHKPIILLDHQPFELDRAEQAGADLMLSGHTHRGQMYPNNWITRRMYEVDWGYLKKDSLHTIVSSGFGFWGPPLRIGSRSEIWEITVTMGTQSKKRTT
ncbi:metallophosphoesterase [Alteribacter aurantiacus]|uniref:metallophosphoesterase n=1 Tax=Alteribacter aurantiacus TaxID=254410 RepID=UPI00040FF714|nr:metallophosphoesterase [Alteribacter aurantiacus]